MAIKPQQTQAQEPKQHPKDVDSMIAEFESTKDVAYKKRLGFLLGIARRSAELEQMKAATDEFFRKHVEMTPEELDKRVDDLVKPKAGLYLPKSDPRLSGKAL